MGTPNTAALLGRVCHQLSDDVAGGSVTSEGELEQRWDELIAAAEISLRNDAFTEPVPTPLDWPGYQLSRARTLIALRPLARERPASAPPSCEMQPSDSDRSVFVELEIVDERSQLIGRIDRVELGPDGTRIIDLKAGWTQELTVTERQRRQLLLYAHLWHERAGEWPTTATIQLADGRSSEIHVNVDEVRSVVADAIEQRLRFNKQIPQGWNGAATPSEDACAFCDFKACCPAFMAEADRSWRVPGEWVRGAVTATTPDPHSASLVPDDPTHSAHQELTIIGLPAKLKLEIGERVGFAGLSRTADPDTLRATWRTAFSRWP